MLEDLNQKAKRRGLDLAIKCFELRSKNPKKNHISLNL